MALAYQDPAPVPHASATLAVGAGTVTGSGGLLPVKYGSDVIIEITNGATGPTTGAVAYFEVARDAIGTGLKRLPGATYVQADLTANAVSSWLHTFNPGAGDGGNWPYYQVKFVAPTGQDVTASAVASTLTSY